MLSSDSLWKFHSLYTLYVGKNEGNTVRNLQTCSLLTKSN